MQFIVSSEMNLNVVRRGGLNFLNHFRVIWINTSIRKLTVFSSVVVSLVVVGTGNKTIKGVLILLSIEILKS